MSASTNSSEAASSNIDLDRSLAEYAARLLLSTGLTAQDAFLIASGRKKVVEQLSALARALQAGWGLEPLDPEEQA